MSDINDQLPILIGVGQTVSHWDGTQIDEAPSPISLAVDAARRALEDTSAARELKAVIDTIVAIRAMHDSTPRSKTPFGKCANPPSTIAAKLGLSPKNAIHSTAGGEQPQYIVNEMSRRLHEGEIKAALICGAEATATLKTTKKKRIKLDWSETVDGKTQDRGFGTWFISEYETKNGLGFPAQTYPIFEHALRKRLGINQDDYRRTISELWAGFSNVAAQNPYAQFRAERSAEFLAAPSKDNFPVADPYLKWHVAQDAVNQGAALIMTTVGTAKSLGVDESKWIYLHGHAEAEDRFVMERPDLSRSKAMDLVLEQALETSGLKASEIDHYDIYSCFPCVVQIAAEYLGIDWREKILTVTGGLPFFGGPGNNYSTHAIASMAERLRENAEDTGLVMANGGFMSKFAAGIYSATPPKNWSPVSSASLEEAIKSDPKITLISGEAEGEVHSYTVLHGRHGPQRGYVMIETSEGRALARAHTGHRATMKALTEGPDPLGQTVKIHQENGTNYISATTKIGAEGPGGVFLGRQFTHVSPVRNGRILEITLNRPKSYNSLHSAAHFELAEIFDEFGRDRDLWVAIITGAGDKAFCSGNDLKATARGGDMSQPRSGFGGLCGRAGREKPVIAAVNGVAMGGGLEIVLACDMAIIVENAKCALPEVKVGLFAAAGGVQRLSRQIGRKAALELILTGRHFGAEEAVRLGVANRIAKPGEAMTEARALAKEILAVSPTSVRASKKVLNAMDALESEKEALAASIPVMMQLMKSNDFKEGVSAFAEKRPPKWTNS